MGDKPGEFKLDPRLTKKYPAWAVGLVDDFFKKANSRDTFEVIDHILKRWMEVFPHEYNEQVGYIKDLRAARTNPHAATPSKAQRHLLSIPPRVMFAIETILGKQRANFRDKKFVRKFARRYDLFRVPARSSVSGRKKS